MKTVARVNRKSKTSIVAVASWCFVSVGVAVGVCVAAKAETFAYVPCSPFVSVIDTATNTVVGTIPLPTPPANIAVTPDGTRVYVASPVANAVYLINTVTRTIIDTISVPSAQGVGATPDGTRVYVTESCLTPSCFTAPGAVAVIDTASKTVMATITSGITPRPYFVRFTPDGNKAFVVGNSCPGSVVVIDTNPKSATYNTVLATIPAGCFPAGVAITVDGKHAYVTDGVSDDVLLIDTSSYGTTSIPVGAPVGQGIGIANGRAYAALENNTAAVISTATNTLIGTVPVGPGAIGVGVTPDHRFVYVTNGSDTSVTVIDTATDTLETTITTGIGSAPFDVGIARLCGGPVISGSSASPSVLWPPNHKMVPVTVSYTVMDDCDPAPVCSLSVSSNEGEGGGSGNTSPDWMVLDAHDVDLVAERMGTGSRRVYTITVSCQDKLDLSSSARVEVTVPHDQGQFGYVLFQDRKSDIAPTAVICPLLPPFCE